MYGKEKDLLRQIGKLFCLREFVVSSDPTRSAAEIHDSEESHDKVTFVTWKRLPT